MGSRRVTTPPLDQLASSASASSNRSGMIMSPAGEALHRLPPTVALLRICELAKWSAVCARTGTSSISLSLPRISLIVVSAPMRIRLFPILIPLISFIWRMLTSVLPNCCFPDSVCSIRSVPPASTVALLSCITRVASSIEIGAAYCSIIYLIFVADFKIGWVPCNAHKPLPISV